ncbi:MAG: aspartate kinase [Acidobacteria bacterium]|nr:aspartate kinase [Acidobacteriota bacterium]
MNVLKFGGSSVASADLLHAVAGIVAEAVANDRAVVVVSALAGVTDILARLVDTAASGDRAWERGTLALAHRHLDCCRELGADPAIESSLRAVLGELAGVLTGLADARSASPASRDAALSTGERLAALLAALAMRRRGLDAVAVDARELVVTDSAFGEAEPDLAATARRTAALLARLRPGCVPVVTGFIGADRSGRTTTLGRGGSDYTASVLGAVLGAAAVEIWTDVSGVLAAPPCDVPHAATLPALTYGEATALARLGAKVLYPKTMDPLARRGIPVVVRNTFDPGGPRTVVNATTGADHGRPRAVTALDGGVLVTHETGPGGLRRDPMAGLEDALREHGGSLCPGRPGALPGAVGLVRGVPAATVRSASLQAAPAASESGTIRLREGVGTVALVGEGLGGNRVAGAQARLALAAARIPVLAEVDAGSDAALALVVQRGHLREAVWVLHEALLAPALEGRGAAAARPAAAGGAG